MEMSRNKAIRAIVESENYATIPHASRERLYLAMLAGGKNIYAKHPNYNSAEAKAYRSYPYKSAQVVASFYKLFVLEEDDEDTSIEVKNKPLRYKVSKR